MTRTAKKDQLSPTPDATVDEPVEQNLPAVRPASAVVSPITATPQYWTSIPASEPGSKAMLAHAFNGEAIQAADMIGQPFEVWHLFGHIVEMTVPETGEVKAVPRTVFVAPDRSLVSSTSEIFQRDISFLCSIYGTPPWVPALTLKIIRVRTSGGRNCYRLVVDTTYPKE